MSERLLHQMRPLCSPPNANVRDGDRLLGVLDSQGSVKFWNITGPGGVTPLGRIERGDVTQSGVSIDRETAITRAENRIGNKGAQRTEERLANAFEAAGIVPQAAEDAASEMVSAVNGIEGYLLGPSSHTHVRGAIEGIEEATGQDGAAASAYVSAVGSDVAQALWVYGNPSSYCPSALTQSECQDAVEAGGAAAAAWAANRVGAEVEAATTAGPDTTVTTWVRRYYVTDHLGSVRAVVDGGRSDGVASSTAGDVVEARDYYAWGLPMPGRVYVQGAETREGFTGHEYDQETGQYYAGARSYSGVLGRFVSVDPLLDHPDQVGMSPYGYAWGNPVSLSDPTGMCPDCSDEEYMPLAEHVYTAKEGDVTSNGWRVVGTPTDLTTGYKSALYSKDIDGERQYVLAFAGTDISDVGGDWVDNALQLIGASSQYATAIEEAASVTGRRADVSFTGHSLGGGLASAAALKVGGKGITFNPAALSDATKSMLGTEADITAYIVVGDALDYAQGLVGLRPAGTIQYHPVYDGRGQLSPAASIGERVERHGMPSVKQWVVPGRTGIHMVDPPSYGLDR